MIFRKRGCENLKWIELAQDYVQRWGLVLPALNLQVLLPESQLIRKMGFREIGCEVGRIGSGSCPTVGCNVSGVEPSGSATRELI
jgi:hypothetical protein